MNFITLTKENFNQYANQIVDLCNEAVKFNENNDKKGQFYTTTFKELLEEQIRKNEFQENNPIRRYITDRLYEEYKKIGKVEDYTKTAFYALADINKEKLIRLARDKNQDKDLTEKIKIYELFLQAQSPVFISLPTINIEKYFESNMDNAMEINTYIVNPTYRGNGLAKILLYEALKRKMEDYFLHTDNDVLYLNTTIHNDNINSQKIISIIKMEDYLYIERTKGINRRVYFKKVCRDNYQDLLHEMEIELLIDYNYYSRIFGIDLEQLREIIKLKINEYNNGLQTAGSIQEKEAKKAKLNSLLKTELLIRKRSK